MNSSKVDQSINEESIKPKKKKKKEWRNPNGYGSVYKQSGSRRKPWIVRITVNWEIENGEAKQKRMILGSYVSKKEAMTALALYNNDPFDIVKSKLTFADVYREWSEKAFQGLSDSAIRNYVTPYKSCVSLYEKQIREIDAQMMQRILDAERDNGKKAPSLNRIRILFNQIFKFCVEHEYIRKNYAENLKMPETETVTEERKAFSTEEIQRLWDNVGKNEYIPIILMLIYSGVRIMELLDLKKEDVHIEEQYFNVRASKTNAGIRIVPIADKVLPFWKSFIERSTCEYAISTLDGKKHMTYDNFKKRYWFPLMNEMNMKHVPHETRHTCASLLAMADANHTIVKKILGHKGQMDLTERVYTHIEVQKLLEAINLI